MSNKVRQRRAASLRPSFSPPRVSLAETPRVEGLVPLICGVCGVAGRYNVGTVLFDPYIARSVDESDLEEAVGFTSYFRCRKCNAGGPWRMPQQTLAYVMSLVTAAIDGAEDVPLFLGAAATFDGKTMRYATDGEAHLKKLIDGEPERVYLWVRLGNLYNHTGQPELARPAYERAIELDPQDIEAHAMLGHVLTEAGRSLDAVPHWHAVLRLAHNAHHVDTELRRNLVRSTIQYLRDAYAEFPGRFELFPTTDPGELQKRNDGKPLVLELRQVNLRSERGVDDLCDLFMGPRPQRKGDLFSSPRRRERDFPDDRPAATLRRAAPAVGRNDPCPCGSGRKYKKCCGH